MPAGVKIIVPRYAGPHNPPNVPAGVRIFGHQYADDEATPPFGPTDINQSRMTLSAWLEAWGVNGGVAAPRGLRDAARGPAPAGLTNADRALLREVRELLDRKERESRTAPAPKKRAAAKAIKVAAKAPATGVQGDEVGRQAGDETHANLAVEGVADSAAGRRLAQTLRSARRHGVISKGNQLQTNVFGQLPLLLAVPRAGAILGISRATAFTWQPAS